MNICFGKYHDENSGDDDADFVAGLTEPQCDGRFSNGFISDQ